MEPTKCLLRHLVLAVHRCLLTTPMCEKGSNCQGTETCDRTLRPKRLCQPPACPVACLARPASREPWTCTHARVCAQACYANDLLTVDAMMPMIPSAITANASDLGLNSPAGNRPHCGLPTPCLLRHFGLPVQRCLLTTPMCKNVRTVKGRRLANGPCAPSSCANHLAASQPMVLRCPPLVRMA
jgi:hypothetical protein